METRTCALTCTLGPCCGPGFCHVREHSSHPVDLRLDQVNGYFPLSVLPLPPVLCGAAGGLFLNEKSYRVVPSSQPLPDSPLPGREGA